VQSCRETKPNKSLSHDDVRCREKRGERWLLI